ncbi:hypothetical protein F5I97DRAFT_1878064 [Phlebopus sp. FC_14]|nr:hypothetical protein F5I97DRAFT_1878064 [Phlebopus sp. FC_14]
MLTAAFRPPSGGWYTRPQPQMQRRGRSRQVSAVALARIASEERRRASSPQSDPSMNIQPSASSPPLRTPSPSPSQSHDPQSLQDQIQVAYALGHIRLAKILLLKLKGIQVASDSDPRIDQVRDEDFDMCFAPSGPLTLEQDVLHALQETRRKQRQWWQESQRAQRLRACEKVWQDGKQRLHHDRIRAIQRREEMMALEDEHRRQQAERELHQRSPTPRFNDSRPSLKRHEHPFQYSFMPPTTNSIASPSCRSVCSPQAIKKNPMRSPPTHSAVSFKEVLNSMNGNLFPLDPSERVEDAKRTAGLSSISSPSRYRRSASLRAELLGTLLQAIEWPEEACCGSKGKAPEPNPHYIQSPVLPHTPMPSVPSSDSVTSVASPSTSRSSSWLSFSSWRSSATDVTIPDSPASASPCCSVPCLPIVAESRHELLPRCSFVRISLDESPLSSPSRALTCGLDADDIFSAESSYATGRAISSSDDPGKTLVGRVARSLSGIVHAAKGIQSAYITATMFSAGSSSIYDPSSRSNNAPRCKRRLRPEGYRALAEDVKKFTASTPNATLLPEPVHFIPLVSPFPMAPSIANSKSASGTVVVIPSPLRPRTPPAVLAYRMRPVANPALLRLRALQNLMCARGKEWEGRARDGGLGCGKERMLGVAFEGRGRSGLGCEVRFVVA